MSKLKDLTGQKFGRLTVIERAGSNPMGALWKCRCDCGKECIVLSYNLRHGDSKSCGCLHREISSLGKFHTKHGMSNLKVYRTWADVLKRCFNSNHKFYGRYGGRGIAVYPAWVHDFQAFYDYVSQLEHFGEERYTLDRIDNNGNYEPNNLRWADRKTQDRNKRTNHTVEFKGVTMTVAEAAEKSGINKNTLLKRIRKGDRGEKLFRPVKKR